VTYFLFGLALGLALGAFVWVPLTLREAERRRARDLAIARRIMERMRNGDNR
jgi:hypothetical protein